MSGLPAIILWVWERPEDLRRLPDRFGAAVLVATIRVESGRVAVVPRRQPARLAPVTPWIPVVRIETARAFRPDESDASPLVIDAIVRRVRLLRATAVQIDFDARRSERAFYRRILTGLRERLGDSTAISITALASWCSTDPWFSDLPIDEAVPMLFRMGPDERGIREAADFDRSPLCRGTAGVATDESWPRGRRNRRLYVFSPAPWTDAGILAVEEAASR